MAQLLSARGRRSWLSRVVAPAPGLAAAVAIAIAMAMAMLGSSGCYNPKVAPGGLRCAAAPAKQCPDGLTCVGGVCQAADGAGGRGGNSGSGGAGGTCASPILPLCQTPPGTLPGCDPVCQTGCGCGLRCNVTPSGTGCGAVLGVKTTGEICTPASDECLPGLVCLREPCGTDLGRCYRFCREHSTCGPGGVCGTPIELPGGGSSGQKVCNVGDEMPACDVFARTGCLNPALVCYVAGQNTKCDCPRGTNRMEGQTCSFYNDCVAGLTCLNLGGVSQCHKVCKTNADCGGATCTISGASGYCP